MAIVAKIVQGGGTLVDFTDGTNFALVSLDYTVTPDERGMVAHHAVIDVLGASNDAVAQNLITLHQAILNAKNNFDKWKRGQSYTPIYFQTKLPNGTYTVQAEMFGDWNDTLEDLLAAPILSNLIENVSIPLLCRPYFEETARVALAGSPFTVSNNGGSLAIPNTLRGDLPAPLYVKVRTGMANADRVILALRGDGTVANFVAKYEAESAAVLGSGVGLVADAAMSPGSGNSIAQWTPGVTTEQGLIGVTITTNLVDKIGKFRLLAAVKDEAAALNTKIRGRMGLYTGAYSTIGGAQMYGDWGDVAKYALAVSTRALIDCGVVSPPDTGSAAVAGGMVIEIYGTATATGATKKFDLDALYLLSCFEGGDESGYIVASFPTALGTGVQPDGVVNSHDRVRRAYVVNGSDVLVLPATDINGKDITVFPGRAQNLYVLTAKQSNGNHDWNQNQTVTCEYTPRYRVFRGN